MNEMPRDFKGSVRPSRWGPLWRGRSSTLTGLLRFAWAFFLLWLVRQLWGTAVRLAHFPPPTKTMAPVLAIVAILLLLWSLRALWLALRALGLKRLAITAVVIFGLVALFRALTVPDPRPFPARLAAQAASTGQGIGEGLWGSVQAAARAPDEFLFAYTGERTPPGLPEAFPTPDPEATPAQAISVPAGSSDAPVHLPTPVPEPTRP